MLEITSAKQNIEKRMRRNENRLADLRENIKCTNIHIIGVPEGEKREGVLGKLSEDIIGENFPNMGKEVVNHVLEAQSPSRINPRPMVIKLTKIKEKDKLLKATREKRQHARESS